MTKLIRNVISRIPGLRHHLAKRIFLSGNNTHRFWGIYKTEAEAKAWIPASSQQNFDSPELDENFSLEIQERDQPLIRILKEVMPSTQKIFDLGGSIGLCFYRFRTMVPYPPAWRWTVCDVPFVNEFGRKLAAKKNETQLAFTENRLEASGTDVYLTCGALQYFEKTLAEILSELEIMPVRVLVNRVPLTTDPTFYTLQNMKYSIVPYHVLNLNDFISSMEAIGYKLEEKWDNHRLFNIILRDDRPAPTYYGFHFTKV